MGHVIGAGTAGRSLGAYNTVDAGVKDRQLRQAIAVIAPVEDADTQSMMGNNDIMEMPKPIDLSFIVPPAVADQWAKTHRGQWVLGHRDMIAGASCDLDEAWRQANAFIKSRGISKRQIMQMFFE